jgi:hypothetical protein
MISNALVAAGHDTTPDLSANFPFSDKETISSWALDEVMFCNQNSIMSGTSTTTISPLLNTPREQAIILVNRAFTAFVH